MTIKLSSLMADLVRQTKGDWVDAPNLPGVRFNVSSFNVPAYKVARERLLRQWGQSNRVSDPALETERFAALGRLYHEHILHDWAGLDVAFGADIALKVLTDPAYRKVVEEIELCAATLAQLTPEYVEDGGVP